AGFVQAPLSQQRWVGGSVELHCEAVGSPVPEIQWWFEGHGPNDTCSQLWDGARLDRVHIHATYHQHAASTITIDTLAEEDTGTYECRASNDPDRNHLTRAPRVKWVRAQAVVLVLEPGTVSTSVENIGSKTLLTCSLNDSSTEVTGHRWLKGGAVLKEDTLPGQKTDFESRTQKGATLPGPGHKRVPHCQVPGTRAGLPGSVLLTQEGATLRPAWLSPQTLSWPEPCHHWSWDGPGSTEPFVLRLTGKTVPGCGVQSRDQRVDSDDLSGEYSCVFLPEPTGRADIQLDALLSGAPRVKAVKSSEHVSEGETAVLACKSESLPPVTNWVWYKITDSGDQVIVNGSQGRFFVSSSQSRSELRIENLNMEADPGKYACWSPSSSSMRSAGSPRTSWMVSRLPSCPHAPLLGWSGATPGQSLPAPPLTQSSEARSPGRGVDRTLKGSVGWSVRSVPGQLRLSGQRDPRRRKRQQLHPTASPNPSLPLTWLQASVLHGKPALAAPPDLVAAAKSPGPWYQGVLASA
uniref:Basigin n=1 Tax=Papio anubis TaxID=9555 RepID=A0A8I5NL30_PAPAN